MPAARLLERFRDVLASRTEQVDHEALGFSVDFVRLAVRALNLAEPTPEARALLAAPVRSRSGLDDGAINALIELALAPEFRGAVDEHALRSFGLRFGKDAARILREEAAEELDLGGFAARYGTADSLLLLDTLFAVTAVDQEIDRGEVQRLEQTARELEVDPVLVTALLQKHDPRHAAGDLRFPLEGNRIVIGRSPAADVQLPDPQVARQHAELVCAGGAWRVLDLESGRPTLVNGRVQTSAPFDERTVLRIGPYTLRMVGNELRGYGERSFAALTVRNLNRRIGDVVLLDDVNFTVFSGEVVALVGPSGAGKTTLLNAINGVAPADSGQVRLDGDDFHHMLAADRSLVGIVPQDDLVHAELTVEESLGYSGQLRFGGDVEKGEVAREVDRVLEELDIGHIRSSRIGDALQRGISGGQRKRVNLGQELMSRSTRVLFLDEPTSGLDPRASQEIVSLTRQLADAGRMVFLVTHDLTPEVMAQVDHLLVMAPGGRLAFFGPPEQATRYFRVPTADAIFGRFKEPIPPEEWAREFRCSAGHRKYVASREHLLPLRAEFEPDADGQDAARRRGGVHQLWTLTTRYARVKMRDRTGLLVLGLQPPVLAAVMLIVYPKPIVSMFFMITLSCLWFGMSASVRELISDRVIWHREHRIGVGVIPYVMSKVGVLGVLIAVQCAFLYGVMHAGMGLGVDLGFVLWKATFVAILTGWVGMAVGLFTSSVWKSSEAAVGTLPLLLIPQITFSGILVSISDMDELAKAVTWGTFQRYSFDALLKCGEKMSYIYRGKWDVQGIVAPLYNLGLKPKTPATDMGISWESLVGIHLGIILFVLGATMLVVRARARRS